MEALRPEDPRWTGDYRLLGRLGAGGMGRVFLGRSRSGRMVAVKLVHPELARDPQFRRRFRLEIDAARRVGGEWTAPVLDADTESDTPWVATGYVPGPTLSETVERHGPLPEATVLALAAGLARALQAVHGSGLIHRDLKPSNVLVTIDGPRVIDFGIARLVDGSVATRTGALIGSPGFMSPEQVRGTPLTTAGDIFCLGSVLAYAALGRPPFGAGDSGLHALLFRVAQEPPDLGDLTGPVRDLVESCLAKEPAERPTLAEILESLPPAPSSWLPSDVIAELGRHAAALLDLEDPEDTDQPLPPPPPAPPMAPAAHLPPPGPAPDTHPQPPRRPSRAPLYAVTGATAAVAVLLVAVFVALADRDGRRPVADRSPLRASAVPSTRGAVPARMIGTWEGWVRRNDTGSQWLRRINVEQGWAGDTVARVRSANNDELCEFDATLLAGGPSIEIRTRTTRSLPAGKCGKGARQRMTLNGDGTVHWASQNVSGTLARTRNEQIPAQYRRTWRLTLDAPRPGSAPDRTFEIGAGPVGKEAIKVTAGQCQAMATLVSAENEIVFFSSRLLTPGNGCTLGGMQKLTPRGDGSLFWENPGKGDTGTARA
ncbi:serine/threonine-protein kinase [Spirillospora sp. CA-255316]